MQRKNVVDIDFCTWYYFLMKAEVKQLDKSIKKKLKQLGEGAYFNDEFLIKYFGKPAQKLYRDYAKSVSANMLQRESAKNKRKGKKHYSKKVR